MMAVTEFLSNPSWPFIVAWPIVSAAIVLLSAAWFRYLGRKR